MLNAKKRIIDLDIEAILTPPENITIGKNKFVCCFSALVSYPQAKTTLTNRLGASMIIKVIAPPYTEYLFKTIYKRYSNDAKNRISFLKLWGYPYKPNRDNVAFYCLEATERLPNEAILNEKEEIIEKETLSLMFNSHFVGIDYLKSKYEELRSNDRSNDYNIFSNYYLTKKNGKNAIFYYPKDYSQYINVFIFANLYKITNPDNLQELQDKPLFYQIIGHFTDRLHKEHPKEDIASIRKYVLANRTYEALKPKSTEAQD